jgi:uncharacterized OB-fold protein
MKNLSKWIAENIMGECWHKIVKRYHNDNPNYWHECEKCGKLYLDPQEDNEKPYATDLNLAFEAAKKYGMNEYFVRLSSLGTIDVITVDPDLQYIADHKNPATAICLAIYKLKMGTNWIDGK